MYDDDVYVGQLRTYTRKIDVDDSIEGGWVLILRQAERGDPGVPDWVFEGTAKSISSERVWWIWDSGERSWAFEYSLVQLTDPVLSE